jgi:hypothetical protein
MMILPAPRSVRRSRNEYLNVSIANQTPQIPPAVQGSFQNRILSGLGQLSVGNFGVAFPRPPTNTGGESGLKTAAMVDAIVDALELYSGREGVKKPVVLPKGSKDPDSGQTLTMPKTIQVDQTVPDSELSLVAGGSEIRNKYMSGQAPALTDYGRQIGAWLYLNYRDVMRWAKKVGVSDKSATTLLSVYQALVGTGAYPTPGSVTAILASPKLGVTTSGTSPFTAAATSVNPADVEAFRKGVALALRLFILLAIENERATPSVMTADQAKIQFSLVEQSELNTLKARYNAASSKYDAAKAKLDEIAAKVSRGVFVLPNTVAAAESEVGLAAQSINTIAAKFNELQNFKAEWENKITQRLYVPVSELTAAELKLADALSNVNDMLRKLTDGEFVAPTDLQQAYLTLEVAVGKLKANKSETEGWYNAVVAGLNSLVLAGKQLSKKNYKSQVEVDQLKQELESIIEESKNAAKGEVRAEYASYMSPGEVDVKVAAAVAPLQAKIVDLEAEKTAFEQYRASIQTEYIKITELEAQGYIKSADAAAAKAALEAQYTEAQAKIVELQAQIDAAGGGSTPKSPAPPKAADNTGKAAGAALAIGIPVALLATGPIGIAAAAAAFFLAKGKK